MFAPTVARANGRPLGRVPTLARACPSPLCPPWPPWLTLAALAALVTPGHHGLPVFAAMAALARPGRPAWPNSYQRLQNVAVSIPRGSRVPT